jgi:hypothetical protein
MGHTSLTSIVYKVINVKFLLKILEDWNKNYKLYESPININE